MSRGREPEQAAEPVAWPEWAEQGAESYAANRTWATGFRGRILIHAGKRYPKGEYAENAEHLPARYGIPYPMREDMIGGIVGEGVVTACVTSHPSEWFHGPFGFVIERPIAYPSLIPYRGALGIFGVPANVLDDVGHNGSPHA